MSEPHASDAATAARQQTPDCQRTQPGLVWVVVSVVILFILPEYLTAPYDGMSMGLGAAALFTVFLYRYPEPFRSRRGSLVSAFCLVAALWLLVVVSTVLSFIG